MRNRSSQRVVAATVCIAVLGFAFPVAAESDPNEAIPAGHSASESIAETDLDEAFELELDRTSDMRRLDPYEAANRKTFAFNQGFINYVVNPLTTGYRFVVPKPLRRGLRLAFLNVDSPRILLNDLLQLQFKAAGETLGRLTLNTAFGFGGLFDVGAAAGWERHNSDFGQTLGKYGVASGPYLMVPVFGPTTLRDGVGSLIDLTFQPLAYILGPAGIILHLYIESGVGLTALDANRDTLEALEESSVDYYVALRSAYLQGRQAAVAKVRTKLDSQGESEKNEIWAEAPEEDSPTRLRADAFAP